MGFLIMAAEDGAPLQVRRVAAPNPFSASTSSKGSETGKAAGLSGTELQTVSMSAGPAGSTS
jgi:hypothetical protein